MEQSLAPSIPSIPSIPLSSASNPLYSPTNQRAFRLLSEPDLRVSRDFPFSPGSPSPSSSFSPNHSSSPLPSSPSSHSPFSPFSPNSPNYYRSSPPLAFLNKYRQIVDAQGLLPETALFHRFLRSVKRLTKPSNEGRGRSGSESDRERDREKEGRGRMVCFMSYAWMPDKQDNDALQAKLVKIKGDLTIAGVKVMLDIHNMMGEIDKYMINGIKSSGKLLLICTPRLKERADEHGYGLNNLQIELEEALAKQKIDHNFIIPLILNGHRESSIATRLPNILSLDLSDPKEYYSRMTSLSPIGLLPMLLELHDNPLYSDLLSGYHAQVDLLHKELSASLTHSLESLDSDVLTDPLDVNHLAMIHRKIESHIDEIQKENKQLQAKAREGEIMREEVKELKHRLQVSGVWTSKEGENETKKEGLEKRIQGLEAEVERLNREKGELQAAKLELEKQNIELTSKIDGKKNTSGEKMHTSAELSRTSGEFEAFVRDTLGDSRELQVLYKASLLEITTLKERIASLQINHENEIQQIKDKTITETLALQKRISELQLERRDFQAKMDDSATQQQLLASEQKRLMSEISKMQEELHKADKKETLISFQDMDESEMKELRKKNEQLQESIRESQKLHENEVNDLKKKNNEVVNWTLVIQKQMQQKEGQHKSEIENLKKQIKDLNNESETKRRQILELQSTETETQKELTTKLKEIEDFREEKIIMTKELLAMRENNVALQKQVSDGKQLAKWFSLDGGNLLL